MTGEYKKTPEPSPEPSCECEWDYARQDFIRTSGSRSPIDWGLVRAECQRLFDERAIDDKELKERLKSCDRHESIARHIQEDNQRRTQKSRQIMEKCGLFFENFEFKHDVPPEIMAQLGDTMLGKQIEISREKGGTLIGQVTEIMFAGTKDMLIEVKVGDKIITLEGYYGAGFFPQDFLNDEVTIIMPRRGYTDAIIRIPTKKIAPIFQMFAEKLKSLSED